MPSKATKFRWGINLWVPFLFSGIRVREVSEDFRRVRVEMNQRWFNRNYVGTHFGGSLFAMTDPFWMIMVMENLGRDYLVWDKQAEIEFVSPGRGTVHCDFELLEADLERIRQATACGEKYLHWFPMQVLNAEGKVVARLRKQVYVRRKPGR